jgi:hypothetical protein
MLPKSFQPTPRSAPHRGPSVALLAALLAAFILLALSASVVGRIGIDSPDRPLRAPVGVGA